MQNNINYNSYKQKTMLIIVTTEHKKPTTKYKRKIKLRTKM